MIVKLAFSFGCTLFLTILLRTQLVISIDPQLIGTTKTPAEITSTEVAVTNTTVNVTESFQINHNRTDVSSTTTVPATTTLVTSPVSVATTHVTSQTTNSSVDEKEKSKHVHPSKEDSKNHSKSTTFKPTHDHTTEKVHPTNNHTTEKSIVTVTNSSVHSSSITEVKKSTSNTIAAGIVAFICLGIASSAFLGIIAWRYVYRKRHGNREILINEEDVDFNDEDLRHFEATCIQLEPEA